MKKTTKHSEQTSKKTASSVRKLRLKVDFKKEKKLARYYKADN